MNKSNGILSSLCTSNIIDVGNYFATRGSSKSRLRTMNILNAFAKKDTDIIKKIASEFPYGIDTVVDEYIINNCSESKTREVLKERFIRGL